LNLTSFTTSSGLHTTFPTSPLQLRGNVLAFHSTLTHLSPFFLSHTSPVITRFTLTASIPYSCHPTPGGLRKQLDSPVDGKLGSATLSTLFARQLPLAPGTVLIMQTTDSACTTPSLITPIGEPNSQPNLNLVSRNVLVCFGGTRPRMFLLARDSVVVGRI